MLRNEDTKKLVRDVLENDIKKLACLPEEVDESDLAYAPASLYIIPRIALTAVSPTGPVLLLREDRARDFVSS